MLSERFKQLRNELGKSQTEFGAGIGVSRSVINNIERGVTEPSDVFLNHLCVVYNVNREWLETGEGELFDKSEQLGETAKLIESISDSPAMRSLLTTWAQLSDENKAVFERFAADYVDDYMRRKAEADTARTEAMLEEPEADADQKQA
mgnify:CR=1 FL=1